MFSELKPLVGEGSLNLIIAGNKDGSMTITVMPHGAGALQHPMQLTGSPEELDRGFATSVDQFLVARKSLAEQTEATLAVLAAAKEAESKKAVKALTAPASGDAPPAVDLSSDHDDDSDGQSAGGIAPLSGGAESSATQAAPAFSLNSILD